MTAEELLAAMAEPLAEDGTYCTIDPETRVITIPPEYQLLGVESDEKAERIYFKCPKIVGDDIDLSKLALRVNFRNAGQPADQYPVDDVAVDGDNITFSWLLSRRVTQYEGDVNFIVCAVRVHDDATITNEWNTTIATATVLEGLEVDYWQEEEDQARDLLTELLDEIEKKGEEVKESIAAPSDEQVNNAVEKYFEENPQAMIAVDETLTKSGYPADAKVTGDSIESIKEDIKNHTVIDDQNINDKSTWSSKKIDEENQKSKTSIDSIQKQLQVFPLIDDLQAKSDGLWSSEKTNQELQNAISDFLSKIGAESSEREQAINDLTTRVNNIIANSSSTEGNSELVDIRKSYLNKTYATAGEAVRKLEERSVNFKSLLTSSDHLDDITTPGVYGWASIDIVQGLPGSQTYGTLIVFSGNAYIGNSERVVQIVIKVSEVFYRIGIVDGLTQRWQSFFNEYENIEKSHFNIGMRYNVEKFLTKSKAVYGTLPKLTSYTNPDTSSFYSVGEEIGSIIYSSVWRHGNDVFFHRNINTFYSALANPASVVYTKNYYYYNGSLNGIACYYGGVCSTYVSKGIGSKIYYNTAELITKMKEKYYVDESVLEVGDIMISTGHCRLITKITYKDNRVNIIGVSEMATGGFNEIEYTVADFEHQLEKFGGEYKIGRMEGTTYVPHPKVDFCTDVIFEYGNDTYIKIGEQARFYIPSSQTIYVSKNGEDYNSYDLTDYPNEVVNDVVLYDLTSIFSSVGNYRVTTKIENKTVCNINVYAEGTINIEGDTATLSGYENIKPVYYAVMSLSEGTPVDYYPSPDGYKASMTKYKELIENDTFPFQTPITSDGYYLRVYYDTGWGYCTLDSNYIIK